MNKGLSIVELAAKITEQQSQKHDMITDTRQMEMRSGVDGLDLVVGDQGNYGVNQTAHRQIASRLKIPAAYYDRMMENDPGLLSTNVNAWFRRQPERRMVRTLGGNARAFLSDRYQRIDNAQIAEAVLPILADIPDVQIVSSQITDSRMYIQAVSPRIQGEVKKGDVVQAGVVITNSEIGLGSVSVQAMIWRLICLNGAIAPDGKFKAYHVGRRIDDNEDLWADDTRKADDFTVLLKARDMVAAAVDEARFGRRIEQMQGLTGIHVSGNPSRAVDVLAQTIGATEAEQGGILRSLINGGDLSAWGLVNAVTAQAHEAQYDRAVEFEAAGGKLITLPANDWRRILEAA
jgi:hypothetical protein